VTDFLNFLINGLSLGAIYALIAVGYTMVYGIVKLINFAHGEFYMFGAFVGYAVLLLGFGVGETGGEPGVGVLLCTMLVAGLLTGLLALGVERACYRPLRGSGRIVALLAAVGVSLFLQNMGQKTVGADPRKFPPTVAEEHYPRWAVNLGELQPGQMAADDLVLTYYRRDERGRDQQFREFLVGRGEAVESDRLDRVRDRVARSSAPARLYAYGRVRISNRQIILIVTLLVTAAALYALVQHTRFGRAMRGVSVDLEAAQLMGVNVNRVIAGTFFVGAFVAGIGGVLAGGMYYERIDPLMGLLPGLKAFVAAVLGGIGSIPGAILGALLLGVSEKMTEAYLSSGLRDALAFAILIGVLLIRPQGLLGSFEGEKL
jgi:branched-chain amino acid transport system permease protein